LVLRHQLAILQRKLKHPLKPTRIEKMTLTVLVGKLKQFSRRLGTSHFQAVFSQRQRFLKNYWWKGPISWKM